MRLKEEDIMRSLRVSRAGVVCTLFTVLLLAIFAMAAPNNGRQFSGYFDVSGVQEQGELVQVTLHLKLFNHGDDVNNVIVTLFDSSPAAILRGNFQPVKVWKSGQFIEMSQEFSIPKQEFKGWATPPIQPNIVILLQDSNGKTWQRGAQISRRPLVPVTQP
jgi:hypothetical protein